MSIVVAAVVACELGALECRCGIEICIWFVVLSLGWGGDREAPAFYGRWWSWSAAWRLIDSSLLL